MLKRNILVLGTISVVLLTLTSCNNELMSTPNSSGLIGELYDKINSTKSVDFSIEKIEPTNENIIELEQVEEVIEETEQVEDVVEETERVEDAVGEIEQVEDVIEEIEQVEDVAEEIEQVEDVIEEIEQVEDVAEEIELATNTTEEVKVQTLIQNTVSVDNSYLEDALFIGDSILKGFKLFVSPYPDNVIAEQNAGLDQIYNNRDVYYINANDKDTLWNSIDVFMPNPEKIYILIGVNGIPGLENDQSMRYYEDLVAKLKQRFPNKPMYACAVTPITQELSEKRAPSFSTEKINDFNSQLFTLCENYNIYYLPTDENLKDSNGYLISKYDAGDGMHLNRDGHTVLLEYFKNNVASN